MRFVEPLLLTMPNAGQRTWRNEKRVAPTWAPVSAALSFDGKRWVSIDSLANEPENGKRNRTPE